MVLFGSRASAVAALAATVAFGTFGFGTTAQEATPVAAAVGLPNHIHVGTCDNLDPAPLIPLADLVFPSETAAAAGTPTIATPDGMATPMAGSAMAGMPGAGIPVAVATTEVDLALEDIIAGGHAINVHESAENIQNYIACGDIGGMIATGPGMEQGGTLVIGLRELNDSRYSGIAVLEGMDDQTEVSVYLAQDLSGAGTAMDETEGGATPTS